MNYHYWKVHNHANIQLICIQIYIIASNSITKQKQKPKKKKKEDTFMDEKLHCIYWFFSKNCISYI